MSDINPYEYSETPQNPGQERPNSWPEEGYEPQLPVQLMLIHKTPADFYGWADLRATYESLEITVRKTGEKLVFDRENAAQSVKIKWSKLLVTMPSGEKRSFRFYSESADLFLQLARLDVWLKADLIGNHYESGKMTSKCLKKRCYRGVARKLGAAACVSIVLVLLMILYIFFVFSFPSPDSDPSERDTPVLLAIPLFYLLKISFFSCLSALICLIDKGVACASGVILHVLLLLFSVLTLNILGVIWAIAICYVCISAYFRCEKLQANIVTANKLE